MHTTTTRRATRWITTALLPTLFATLLAACGGGSDSTPPPATGNVGPAGATVTSADNKATLMVPPGAVSAPINVALAAATDGYGTDPLIVPGTVYRLDAPDTVLALPADLSIAVPKAAITAAGSGGDRARVLGTERARPLSIVDPSGFLYCQGGYGPGDDVPAGGFCHWKKSAGCPAGFARAPQALQLEQVLGYDRVLCISQPPPKTQFAKVGANQPSLYLPALLTNLTATAKLSALGAGFYAVMVDNIKPVVHLSSFLTPLGNGLATITLTAEATDNVGVVQVKLDQVDMSFSGGPFSQITITNTPLAQFVTAPFTWTSPPMPLASVYTQYRSYAATATDPSGNQGIDVTLFVQGGAPVVLSFAASPATVPFGGGNTTLSWSALNVNTLSVDNGVGDVTGLTSKVVAVSSPTTFTLTAVNVNGTVTKTTAVAVAAQPAATIASFTATPSSLPAGGGSVTLNWNTSNASTLSLDNGIGVVTGTSKVVNVSASTNFTLTASNTTGGETKQANVVVAATVDRFVDPLAGLDTNSCAQAAPCKTIGKAMTGAPSGSAVYLADGSYPSSNSATIPDGVALRATHPGAALLNFVTLTATGSASLNGLVFDFVGSSCSSITAASSTGTPTLAITGVLFKCGGVMNIGGSVKAVMTPGLLANGQYTALAAIYTNLLNLSDTAELLVQGGILDFNSFGQGQYGPGMLNTTGSSKLTLDAVTVRNLKQQAFVIAGSATVVLRNGTVIDHVGDAGDCGAGGAIVVSGGGTLTMDHATVSNGPNAAICIGAGTTQLPTIQLTQSTISGMAGTAIATAPINGPNGNLTADGLALINNGRGMHLLSGASPALSLTLSNLTVTGNSAGGITLSNGVLTLRNSTLSNNGAEGGLTVYADSTVDLGTTASPGGNTFTGNTGAQFNSIVTAGRTVNAVGNIWKPSVQGADANGRYSLPPTFTPVPKVGPTNGANYQIYNASTLNL